MVTSVSAEGRLRAETVPLWRVWAGKAHLEETRGCIPSWAYFGAVWSDSKGRAWGGQHRSGSLARRCFEGGVPCCVPFSVSHSSPQLPTGPVSPTPLAVASWSRVSFPAALGELWGACWLHHADLLLQLQRADERWKGFVASCCTLSASWSSGLSFLETKAGLQPCQRSVRAGSGGAGDVRHISCGCCSSVLQFPSGSVVTSHRHCRILLNYT